MRYRYFDDFRRGISVFAIFSNGIGELGLRPFLIQTEVTFQSLFGEDQRPDPGDGGNRAYIVHEEVFC